MKIKFLVLMIFSFSILFGCASNSFDNPSVSRINSDTIVDLDGFWNDSDVKIVCDDLISQCISSTNISQFIKTKKRSPTVIFGKIKNESTEHIDTSIVAKRMQHAIINSGVMDFVADEFEREALRREVESQAEFSSDETAKTYANEIGADFMIQGSVKSIVQNDGKTSVRTYFINVQLYDLESHKIIWSGESDSIKKIIKRKSYKF